MDKMTFYFREAQSDVIGAKILGDYSSGLPVQLDYFIAAADEIDILDQFITPQGRPGLSVWQAGDFVLNLSVPVLVNAVYAVELFRAAADGTDIVSLGDAGVDPPYLSGTPFLQATITIPDPITVSPTDRLKAKIYMGNPTPLIPLDTRFSLMASASSLVTPFDLAPIVHQPRKERGRFFKKLFRKGELPRDKDGFIPDGVIE